MPCKYQPWEKAPGGVWITCCFIHVPDPLQWGAWLKFSPTPSDLAGAWDSLASLIFVDAPSSTTLWHSAHWLPRQPGFLEAKGEDAVRLWTSATRPDSKISYIQGSSSQVRGLITSI